MDLSIVLSPLGDPGSTRACLESLERTLPTPLVWELLRFDRPVSGEPTPTRFRFLPRDSSLSLAACRNAAVSAARAPLLCFLSPGCVLLPGWLPPMLEQVRRSPLAGCIGNVQREPYSGLIDHAGFRFDADGLPVPVALHTALLPRETHDRHPAISFNCALVTRDLLDRSGGFDESFEGPLGDVDFCLRAASLGYRHYVANRSTVYHAAVVASDSFAPADLALYRRRWGDRARDAHVRRARLRSDEDAPYTPEGWELARESRRLRRQEISDTRFDGRTYLRKHLHRPWRYNYGRLCRALAKAWQPLPPALPSTPTRLRSDASDLTRPDDGWVFDPPPQ